MSGNESASELGERKYEWVVIVNWEVGKVKRSDFSVDLVN